MRGSARGLLTSELVVAVSLRVSQQRNSVRVFLCFVFFLVRVKTALPVRVLHHTGICISRVYEVHACLVISVGTRGADRRVCAVQA